MFLRLLLESKRIMKNTTPDHNTIHTVLLSQLQTGLTSGISPLMVRRVSGATLYIIVTSISEMAAFQDRQENRPTKPQKKRIQPYAESALPLLITI